MLSEILDIDVSTLEARLPPAATPANFGQSAEIPDDSFACDEDHGDETEFASHLLSALAAMAVRSKRRQADLSAALQRSGLKASAAGIMAALHQLEDQGCIEDVVPLYDGGMLMSVTTRGVEHLSAGPRWTMLEGRGFRIG